MAQRIKQRKQELKKAEKFCLQNKNVDIQMINEYTRLKPS